MLSSRSTPKRKQSIYLRQLPINTFPEKATMADNNNGSQPMEEDTSMNNNHPQRPASPSPPPPAPVPLTPGPRATRLQQVFDQALARTLRANSYSNFSSCFPTPARHVPASLESVWRQLNAKLEESAKAEFEDIVQERDAVGQLNELDRLVGEAKFRRDNHETGESQEEGEGEGQKQGENVAYVVLPFPFRFG